MKYRGKAIVLRHRNVNAVDWSVTMLTDMHGVQTALVKGAQRPTHRLRPRLQVGAHIDVELYRGSVVTHARPVEGLCRHSYVAAMMEAAEQLAAEGGRCPELYALTVTALRLRVDPELVFVSFLIRAMDLTGWGLALEACATCGAPGPHRAFNTDAGGTVCDDCRPAGSIFVKPEVIELMTAMPMRELTPETVRQARALVVAHFQRHLECRLPVP